MQAVHSSSDEIQRSRLRPQASPAGYFLNPRFFLSGWV